ncbi:MAG: T9SS type A sorting domain-containing protein [Bacteroidales bacterium]|nr:T9SS type A sorting domain-containing protein [Bacteroidales bacterium]
MEKERSRTKRWCEHFTSVAVSLPLLLALLPARGQYMSFFGDSTWEYNITCISQPPMDYVNNPPDEPNQLGVYCVTYQYLYRKDHHLYNYFDTAWPVPMDELYESIYHKTNGPLVNLNWMYPLYEDTDHGRLYGKWNILLCDMSLSEGDTFVLHDVCKWADPLHWFPWEPTPSFDISMLVDSVAYENGRKVIFLSLIDHQDDYFFGAGNAGVLSGYNLSIRFIEGIGATYGFHFMCEYPSTQYGYESAFYYYYYPWLPLLQCMYKDDSLVYMAHEDLECAQSCWGNNTYIWEDVPRHSPAVVNLYPNPATQYVVLDLSTGEELRGTVSITDMLGKLCIQQKAEGTRFQCNVSNLPTGMYFLTYTDGKMKIVKKFLKE